MQAIPNPTGKIQVREMYSFSLLNHPLRRLSPLHQLLQILIPHFVRQQNQIAQHRTRQQVPTLRPGHPVFQPPEEAQAFGDAWVVFFRGLPLDRAEVRVEGPPVDRASSAVGNVILDFLEGSEEGWVGNRKMFLVGAKADCGLLEVLESPPDDLPYVWKIEELPDAVQQLAYNDIEWSRGMLEGRIKYSGVTLWSEITYSECQTRFACDCYNTQTRLSKVEEQRQSDDRKFLVKGRGDDCHRHKTHGSSA